MEFIPIELNEMPYEKAIKFDERAYTQYYLSLINYKNIVLFTFFLSNDYNSRILKIDLFCDMLIIHFAVNTLFFTDSTIHKIYEDKGSYNFIYQIPQILYSSFISIFLNQILKRLSLSESNILELKNTRINIECKTKNIKQKFKIKFIFFFVFSFIILFFLWLYLSCFCVVYKNTQLHLVKDTLISLGISFVTPFFISILPGIIRISSLKRKNKCLYKFSKIIQLL